MQTALSGQNVGAFWNRNFELKLRTLHRGGLGTRIGPRIFFGLRVRPSLEAGGWLAWIGMHNKRARFFCRDGSIASISSVKAVPPTGRKAS